MVDMAAVLLREVRTRERGCRCCLWRLGGWMREEGELMGNFILGAWVPAAVDKKLLVRIWLEDCETRRNGEAIYICIISESSEGRKVTIYEVDSITQIHCAIGTSLDGR